MRAREWRTRTGPPFGVDRRRRCETREPVPSGRQIEDSHDRVARCFREESLAATSLRADPQLGNQRRHTESVSPPSDSGGDIFFAPFHPSRFIRCLTTTTLAIADAGRPHPQAAAVVAETKQVPKGGSKTTRS